MADATAAVLISANVVVVAANSAPAQSPKISVTPEKGKKLNLSINAVNDAGFLGRGEASLIFNFTLNNFGENINGYI